MGTNEHLSRSVPTIFPPIALGKARYWIERQIGKIANPILLASLAVIFLCHSQDTARAAQNKASAMTTVVNTVAIDGAPKAVFDLITTARLWPQWHPATKAVGGVVERPYGLGDLIHERGRIGELNFETTWKVAEHVRPSRIVLQSIKGPTRITYTFVADKGSTRFTRKLEYDAKSFAAAKDLEKAMRDQPNRALTN
jgi:uncharacterized protein YndB with AHSA1/START domain